MARAFLMQAPLIISPPNSQNVSSDGNHNVGGPFLSLWLNFGREQPDMIVFPAHICGPGHCSNEILPFYSTVAQTIQGSSFLGLPA
jgi:hypothetical protein